MVSNSFLVEEKRRQLLLNELDAARAEGTEVAFIEANISNSDLRLVEKARPWVTFRPDDTRDKLLFAAAVAVGLVVFLIRRRG